jgi:hypothetical protein
LVLGRWGGPAAILGSTIVSSDFFQSRHMGLKMSSQSCGRLLRWNIRCLKGLATKQLHMSSSPCVIISLCGTLSVPGNACCRPRLQAWLAPQFSWIARYDNLVQQQQDARVSLTVACLQFVVLEGLKLEQEKPKATSFLSSRVLPVDAFKLRNSLFLTVRRLAFLLARSCVVLFCSVPLS